MSDDIHSHFIDIGKNVGYDDAAREYYIVVSDLEDGAYERQAIAFCPVCGLEFPRSLRTEWFDRLNKMGVDPLNDPIPPPFEDGTWWRELNIR